MDFISYVYATSSKYPKYEFFGLVDQIRRAATSIALNIAEGAGSGGDNEFHRFLSIAFRSVYEVITAAEIALKLNYGQPEENRELIRRADELCAMIAGFKKTLRKSES